MALLLEALGSKGPYAPTKRAPIADIRGREVAELCLAPAVYVNRSMADLQARVARSPVEVAALLVEAGELFAHGEVAGLSAGDYVDLVTEVSGLPVSVTRSAVSVIEQAAAEAVPTVQAARPSAAVWEWARPPTKGGNAVWVRKGKTLAVNAAGNHPGVHSLWLEAIALGYGVAVRPSRREPFTPHRLVSALWQVGFSGLDVMFLPTDRLSMDQFLRSADLGLVYGGDDVVQTYRDDPRILTQGPGRSKILLTGETTEEDIDLVVDSVASQGGTACVNATAVFVEHDHHEFARQIANRLEAIPALPPGDEAAVLPCQGEKFARAVSAAVQSASGSSTPILGADQIVSPLGDGSAALRPTVYVCDDSGAPQAGIEMPFPCVWVLPWRPGDTAAMRNSLVVTAVTEDRQLVDELIHDPTISNVYLGRVPTYWMKFGVPHDGFLGEFLMRCKGLNR